MNADVQDIEVVSVKELLVITFLMASVTKKCNKCVWSGFYNTTSFSIHTVQAKVQRATFYSNHRNIFRWVQKTWTPAKSDFNEVHRNRRKLTQDGGHCRRKSGVTDNVTRDKDAAHCFSILKGKSRDGERKGHLYPNALVCARLSYGLCPWNVAAGFSA
jgi:hypothetical protein